MTASFPRITFGLIVLNGEPFTRYCLRALYPFAHQIIVAEGACPGAAHIATADGHSRDGTLDVLHDFQREEDPDKKLTIVTAESEGYRDGFWPGEKDEQSRAYAKRATGDYLWQVDVDEFYRREDMRAVGAMLSHDPAVSGASFRQITFWGGFDYVADGPFVRYEPSVKYYRRLFRWGPGYRYVTHRPPTVTDAEGRDLCRQNWRSGRALANQGIFLYHYSLVFPQQVADKCEYYAQAKWSQQHAATRWAERVFGDLKSPFHVHNVYAYPSWLEEFGGQHPPEIETLRADLSAGRCTTRMRPQDDIRQLLERPSYRTGRALLKVLLPAYALWFSAVRPVVRPAIAALRHPRRAMRRLAEILGMKNQAVR